MTEIRICHLYPELMNLYGDRGNVIALAQRCRWHGLEVEVVPVGLDEKPVLADFDIIFMGGGQDREQALICRDFEACKGRSLAEAVEDGAAVLAICGAYQLMGRYYMTSGGDRMPGLNIFEAWTEAGPRRLIGNAVVETDLFGEMATIVGFENHSGRTFLDRDAHPLGRVVRGYGNNGSDTTEGIVHKNAIGTYLHGSVLPKNPRLTDWLIRQALIRRNMPAELRDLNDRMEDLAHQAAIRRSGNYLGV